MPAAARTCTPIRAARHRHRRCTKLAPDQARLGYASTDRLCDPTRQTGLGRDAHPKHVDRKIDVGERHLVTVGLAHLADRSRDMLSNHLRPFTQTGYQHHEIGQRPTVGGTGRGKPPERRCRCKSARCARAVTAHRRPILRGFAQPPASGASAGGVGQPGPTPRILARHGFRAPPRCIATHTRTKQALGTVPAGGLFRAKGRAGMKSVPPGHGSGHGTSGATRTAGSCLVAASRQIPMHETHRDAQLQSAADSVTARGPAR